MKEGTESILDDFFYDGYDVIEELKGGMTNHSYLVRSHADKRKYVVYEPTEFASQTINRERELKGIRLASNMRKITSLNVFFDKKSGVKINEYIEGVSLNKTDDYDINKVAHLLKRLHTIQLNSYDNELDFKENIDFYLSFLEDKSQIDPRFFTMLDQFYEDTVHINIQKKSLCHCDFQKSNVIRGEDGKYYMIDFEFSAANDKIYDIACFANDGNREEGLALLKAYFQDNPKDIHYYKFFLFRMYISLQWYLLALIKKDDKENQELGIDFEETAKRFFQDALEDKEILDKYFKDSQLTSLD
ncbi:MAG: phosphotransferase [Coprobacillus sp.]|nr:phosphotransferase [Coprobacillus sp.]